MTTIERTGPSVLFLCDSDSQIFGSIGLARAFASRGWTVVYGLFSTNIPENVRATVAESFEIRDLHFVELQSVELVSPFDAVGFYSYGSRINAFRNWFAECFPMNSDQRPVLFTGFNGLILEKFEEGVAWRLGYDLVTVGGEVDAETFRRTFAGTPVANQRIVVCGLGFANIVKRDHEAKDRKRLVFAEQAVIPKGRADRLWLIGQFVRIADSSPNWDIVIKVRVSRGETTFHSVRDHVEDLLHRFEPIPSNLIVSAGSLAADLRTADLMMTVSSTAVFEALRSGIPVATIADLGITNQFGTHVFVSSGLAVALDSIGDLDRFVPPTPHPEWLARMGVTAGRPDALADAVEDLRRTGRPLPPPYYGTSGALPLPPSFAFREKLGAARQSFLAGDIDAARVHVAAARRLRPDDYVVETLSRHIESGRPRWMLGPRLLSRFVGLRLAGLRRRIARRDLKTRPPTGAA